MYEYCFRSSNLLTGIGPALPNIPYTKDAAETGLEQASNNPGGHVSTPPRVVPLSLEALSNLAADAISRPTSADGLLSFLHPKEQLSLTTEPLTGTPAETLLLEATKCISVRSTHHGIECT